MKSYVWLDDDRVLVTRLVSEKDLQAAPVDFPNFIYFLDEKDTEQFIFDSDNPPPVNPNKDHVWVGYYYEEGDIPIVSIVLIEDGILSEIAGATSSVIMFYANVDCTVKTKKTPEKTRSLASR